MDKEKVIKKADALTSPVRGRGVTAMSSQHNNIHVVKAAIYTRKSSEEGLEQGRVHRTSCATRHVRRPVSNFNSLDAQREACEAYIKSQKHEGWVLVEKEYSDAKSLTEVVEERY